MSNTINRRNFVRNMAASAPGIILGKGLLAAAGAAPLPAPPADRMKQVLGYRKLDAHVHVWLSKDGPEVNVDFMERQGIDRMFISRPIPKDTATPDDFRVEKLIDLKMIMLMHAEASLGIGGYRMKYDRKAKANASTPEDFVAIAARYPEALFQYAHTGGGGRLGICLHGAEAQSQCLRGCFRQQ